MNNAAMNMGVHTSIWIPAFNYFHVVFLKWDSKKLLETLCKYVYCLSGSSQWMKGCQNHCSLAGPRHIQVAHVFSTHLAGISECFQYTAQYFTQCLQLTEWMACVWHSLSPSRCNFPLVVVLQSKLCPTLCDPMDCSMPGSSVLHYLLEFAQIHVWVSDAI